MHVSLPSRTDVAQRFATTVAVILGFVVAGVGACDAASDPQPKPSVQEYRQKSHIARLTKLKIGVRADQPLMGFRDEKGSYSGFDVSVAKKLAELLGFDPDSGIELKDVVVSDRETRLITGDLDMVVASYSITEPRKKLVRFAGPYLVTSQEVLIPKRLAGQIFTLSDLASRRICVVGGSTSQAHLDEARIPDLQLLLVNKTQECIDGINEGKYDATSTDLTILAGYLYRYPDKFSIINVPFGEPEQLGVGIPPNDPWLEGLIGHFLNESYRKGTSSWWQSAFDTTLGRAGVSLPESVRRQPPPQPQSKEGLPDLIDHGDKVQQSEGRWQPGARRSVVSAWRRREESDG